jgi:iron complex outermembrane receptor protein
MGVAGGSTLLHAGVSRRGRFPALRELYSGALDRFAPNPDLKPEHLIATEAGVTSRLGNGQVQAVGFHHLMKDAVVRVTLEDRRFMRVNRNELESLGFELLASQAFGPVELSGDLTIQNVDLTDTEAGETNRPENLPETFGSVNTRFPLVLGIRGSADLDYTGQQFAIDPATGEDAELDAAAIAGLSISRAWSLRRERLGTFSQIEVRLALDNVGDKALYDLHGLPGPGRRLRADIHLF